MNSLFRQRTITQIVASRLQKSKTKKQQIKNTSLEQPEAINQHKVEYWTRKNNLNNEDKVVLLRHIEKKYRIRFQSIFAANLSTWIIEREKKVIDKSYDSSKRSYYILKGKVSICERGGGLRETRSKQGHQQYEQIALIQGENAIGNIFDQEKNYHRCVLIAQNAVLLRIDHPQDQLNHMQRSCLLTNEQRQNIVKKFILFKNLDNVNKHHTPYFHTKLVSRGQLIYNIGDPAQYLYMVVQGQIEFQSKIPIQNPEIQKNSSIAALTLRNSIQKYLTVGTQTITAGNFFGEEELLELSPRQQVAKCLSSVALLILVPYDRFQKLLYHYEFKDTLIAAATDRKQQRKSTIQSLSHLHPHKKQNKNKQNQKSNVIDIDFNQFNQKVYQISDKFLLTSRKISLPETRTKLLHGNPIKVPPKFKPKNVSFSMLQVNRDQYLKSMKKFKLFEKEQKKRHMIFTQNLGFQDEKTNRSDCVRTLQQIWRVLKLEQVLQDQNEKMVIQNKEGRSFYNAHMRMRKHIFDHKSYRPKTISSSSRVKTQYVQYLQNMI